MPNYHVLQLSWDEWFFRIEVFLAVLPNNTESMLKKKLWSSFVGNPHFSDFLLVVFPNLETKSISVSWYSDGFFLSLQIPNLFKIKMLIKKTQKAERHINTFFFIKIKMYFYIIYIWWRVLSFRYWFVLCTNRALYVVYKTWLLVVTLSVEVQMYSLASS